MVYGYVRVSTEKQNLENQKKAISEKYKVRKWIEEKKSGTIDYHKRNLGVLIEQLKEGGYFSNYGNIKIGSKS